MVPKLVFVGGFLGAGKTTLILNACRILQKRGLRVAIILNDQDRELVDTKYAQAEHVTTAEVAGGCFCCRFSDLLDSAKVLAAHNPDVIFAEPVGSCIDLAATILRPFHDVYRDAFDVAPLTVLLDPELTREALAGAVSSEITYLFLQQIREADILCFTKSDLHPLPMSTPFAIDFHLSARSGDAAGEWLDEVLSGNRIVGARLLDVDYPQYADAEAALGWLNAQAFIRLNKPVSPAMLIGPLLDKLDQALSTAKITIAHLKLFDQTATGHVIVTIARNGAEPDPRGDLIAESSQDHELAINLRAQGDPASIRAIVEQELSDIPGIVNIKHLRAFAPLPPTPEYRYTDA